MVILWLERMAEEKSEEESLPYGKGIPARQLCTDEILISLMNREMTFTNFIDQFKDRASRGTVNRYLDELSDDSNGKVNFIVHKSKGRSLGPYILTEAGKKEAEERLPSYVLRTVTNQERNQFIYNYKMLVTNKILVGMVQEVLNPKTRHNYSPKSLARAYHGLKEKKLRSYEATESVSNAIEKDLLSLGFVKVEIIKMWLLSDGFFIQDTLLNLGAPEFWKLFSRQNPPECEVFLLQDYSKTDREYMIKEIKKILNTTKL